MRPHIETTRPSAKRPGTANSQRLLRREDHELLQQLMVALAVVNDVLGELHERGISFAFDRPAMPPFHRAVMDDAFFFISAAFHGVGIRLREDDEGRCRAAAEPLSFREAVDALAARSTRIRGLSLAGVGS